LLFLPIPLLDARLVSCMNRCAVECGGNGLLIFDISKIEEHYKLVPKLTADYNRSPQMEQQELKDDEMDSEENDDRDDDWEEEDSDEGYEGDDEASVGILQYNS